jgi:hypothetical protein
VVVVVMMKMTTMMMTTIKMKIVTVIMTVVVVITTTITLTIIIMDDDNGDDSGDNISIGNIGQILEIIKEFIYLGVKLESLGEWRRQEDSIKAKGKQTLRTTDKCLMTVPNMNIEVLHVIWSSNIGCERGGGGNY